MWEDVGNAYFIRSAGTARQMLAGYGAIPVGDGRAPCGLVIGSDGGGLSYITDPDGPVYRTRTATLDEPELDVVAQDLQHFLELLELSLTRFIAMGNRDTCRTGAYPATPGPMPLRTR
ncbi:hypothetical protein OG937_45230 [Streptomyces sp. NBC_00510]